MLVEKIKKLLLLTQERANLEKKISGLKNDISACVNQERALVDKEHAMQQQIRDSKKKVAMFELDIKSLVDRENEVKKRLMGLTRQKEIDSIKREILSLQEQREEVESDLLQELDLVTKQEKAFLAEKPIIEEQIGLDKKKHSTLEGFVFDAQKELDPILKSIESEISNLPDSFKSRYNRIASRLDRPIVLVVGNYCGACYSFISTQQLTELKKMQIGDCKNCSRILFASSDSPVLNNANE